MNQVDKAKFLAEMKLDIAELKTRIWERVAKPLVPNSSNQGS